MKEKAFQLPGKHIRGNKKKRTLHVAKGHYYDHLPKGLTPKVVDKVHEWDDIYLASAIEQSAKAAARFKKGQATLTVELPSSTCTVAFAKDEDPLVVVQTDYGSDTAVGKTLSLLSEMANQKVS